MANRNAQLSKTITFYFSNPSVYGGTGEIIMGLPEQYAAPAGFEKVVCTSTAAAERWSARMRVWEETKEKIAQAYQRHQESEQYDKIASQMRNNIANAPNQLNRDFAVQAYENFKNNFDERMKGMERTSFLHSEAYEADDKEVRTPKVRLPKKLAQGGVFEQ
jgi:hypothetical protein